MARKQDPMQDIPAGWEVVSAPTPAPAAAPAPAAPAPVAAAPDPAPAAPAPTAAAPDLPPGFEEVVPPATESVDVILGDDNGTDGKVFQRDGKFFAKVKGGEIPIPTTKDGTPAVTWTGDHWEGLVNAGSDSPSYGPQEGESVIPSDFREMVIKLNRMDGVPPPVEGHAARIAGLKSGALQGWDDEIGGLGGAVGNWLGRNADWTADVVGTLTNPGAAIRGADFSWNKGTGDFWKDYENERRGEDEFKTRAWEEQPLEYATGYVPGMVTNLALPGGRAVQGESAVGNAMRLSGVGGAYAAISGAGNAQPGERIPGAMHAAPVGMALGPLAAPVSRGVGSLLGRVGEATGISQMFRGGNALNSGLDVLERRMTPAEVNAIPDRVSDMRAAGVEPRLVDVVGEGGRGAVRSVVTRSGPARTELAEHADTVYTDVQDRVADQARRIITPDVDPRLTSRRLAREIEGERNALATPEFDAVRGQPVEITGEIAQVLDTPEGMRALMAARGLMQPAEREQVNAVIAAVRQGNLGRTVHPEAQRLIDQLPIGMSDAARQSATQQIISQFPAPPTATMTVDIADKLSRSLLGRARANTSPGLSRVSSDMGHAVRDAARQQVAGYDTALRNYEARSGVANAASREGRFADAKFTGATADVYSDTVNRASPERVQMGAGELSERDALRVAAREEIADKATSGSANAYRTARDIASGSAQMDRSRALLGQRGAGQLRDAMRGEADRVANTRYVDDRIGSKTAGVLNDQGLNSELINLVPNAMSGGKWAVVRGVADYVRRAGVRGIDAERLVRDAISENPARVDQAVEYLVGRKMNRQQASTLVRSIVASALGRSPQAFNQGPAPQEQ